MSTSKFMVYLSTGSAATALELLRRVCQPDSRSLPHITARYSSLDVKDEALERYLGALIDDLILTEVGTFDDPSSTSDGLSTVIVKCESEDLEWLSYKPDFPDSIFHFTIYDGPRSRFAARVLDVMQTFRWDLRILGSSERVELYNKSRGRVSSNTELLLTPSARSLLRYLSPDTRTSEDLLGLTNAERLELVRSICEFIHTAPDIEPDKFHPLHLDTTQAPRYGNDIQTWDKAAIDELTPSTAIMPDERETAMFLTPPELAFDVARAAALFVPDGADVDFGDPAIGPGIFFAALRQVIPRTSIHSATGVEIDPGRAKSSAQRWRRSGLQVVVGDFLTRRPLAQRWNLLLANPPYVRHQEIDRPTAWLREQLYENTGVRIDGRSDLYVYFILSAQEWLAEAGVAAWLVPSEIASTDFASAIRSFVTSSVSLRRLHTYDKTSPLFDNARVSSTVVIYQNLPATDSDLVEITRGGTLDRPAETMLRSVSSMRDAPKWTWAALTKPSRTDGVTVGDVFDIKRGIATGANAFFLLSDADVERYDASRRWIRPVLPKSRTIVGNIIESDPDGVPSNVDRLWLIDTAEPIESIAESSPIFASYLRDVKQAVGDRTLVAQRRPFYRQERRPVPDFVFIYMAKDHLSGSRRFIRNESRAVILNNYLGMYLMPRFREMVELGILSWTDLQRSLWQVSSETLAQYGRHYISGLLKLEPTELRAVPLDLPISPGSTLI